MLGASFSLTLNAFWLCSINSVNLPYLPYLGKSFSVIKIHHSNTASMTMSLASTRQRCLFLSLNSKSYIVRDLVFVYFIISDSVDHCL